ncbi:hypothetical protein [Candidatus Albibeggiatoa sp. nov. NOAA]|uniref:XAC2610-related protein n=1 Tax=Candidatus Albibeggiatoa sp. nov. NOAA TaxID=3162724 RepID=UPI003302E069|nr:hypothetical protein [Thiotrichaceae bacterium]
MKNAFIMSLILFSHLSFAAQTTAAFDFKLIHHRQDENWIIDKIEVYNQKQQLLQQITGFRSQVLGFDIDMIELEIEDMNFDGYLDIRLPQTLPIEGGIYFYYWFYDPEQQLFIRNKILENFRSPEFNNHSQTIKVYSHQTEKQYRVNHYRYQTSKKLQLFLQQAYKQVGRHWLEAILERDKKGEMVLVEQNLVSD